MFGVDNIEQWYSDTIIPVLNDDRSNAKMLAMSLLSDVQEMLVMSVISRVGDEARQTINRAKWVISNKL